MFQFSASDPLDGPGNRKGCGNMEYLQLVIFVVHGATERGVLCTHAHSSSICLPCPSACRTLEKLGF